MSIGPFVRTGIAASLDKTCQEPRAQFRPLPLSHPSHSLSFIAFTFKMTLDTHSLSGGATTCIQPCFPRDRHSGLLTGVSTLILPFSKREPE